MYSRWFITTHANYCTSPFTALEKGSWDKGENNKETHIWIETQQVRVISGIVYDVYSGVLQVVAGYSGQYPWHCCAADRGRLGLCQRQRISQESGAMLERGWRVELLSWNNSCSRRMRDWVSQNDKYAPLDTHYYAIFHQHHHKCNA